MYVYVCIFREHNTVEENNQIHIYIYLLPNFYHYNLPRLGTFY